MNDEDEQKARNQAWFEFQKSAGTGMRMKTRLLPRSTIDCLKGKGKKMTMQEYPAGRLNVEEK